MRPILMPTDIVYVKSAVQQGRLKVVFYEKNILLQDTVTGERVKIGELPREENDE